jgi:hypothetical protein
MSLAEPFQGKIENYSERSIRSFWLMNTRKMVAGTTTIRPPARMLYMKLANEGVIKYFVLQSKYKDSLV